MQYPFRAGLALFLLTFLLALTSAAPIRPGGGSTSLITRHTSSKQSFSVGQFDQNVRGGQENQVDRRSSGLDSLTTRELEPVEMVTLNRRSIFSKIKHAFQKLGHAIKKGFQKVGQGIKKVAQKIGHGIKKVAQKIGHGIKKVAQKIGHGIKTAAKKVGHFIKTTGAKIAKVGLKIISTVQKAASKIVQFIPVIGKPLSKVMNAEGTLLNKASDSIHAHIGGKLGKAMNNMGKAQKVMGYIPRDIQMADYEERDFYDDLHDIWARDIEDWEEMYERGWDSLEEDVRY